MFPEGTRSLDGELRAFRHGAFTLALQRQVPVLPIILDGTLEALPKHGLTLRNAADIVVQVLEPIDVTSFPTADGLRDHVRAVMAAALAALRAERNPGMPQDRLPTAAAAR
jgi:1-acyl-sn-glycerol-3-phosphate acyltransferase